MAVGQNQWDVHWGYGILTPGHMGFGRFWAVAEGLGGLKRLRVGPMGAPNGPPICQPMSHLLSHIILRSARQSFKEAEEHGEGYKR